MPPPKLSPKTRRIAAKIGERIRAARLDAGISQEALASRIGMSRSNFSRIEYGLTNVTCDSLSRIAEGLGLDLVVAFEVKSRLRKSPS